MKEYGPNQYEVVVAPEEGVRAADAAVILRELTRSTARAMGEEATFTPIRDASGIGNGVHIHMSFIDADGDPATYDGNGPCGMSELTGAFCAGILAYLENIVALTAPSVISYERLTPHRWSAAYNNLGFRDREASLRICPVTAKDTVAIARQFNIEYRAADAAACPHLALAAIVHAGVQGVEDGLAAPLPTREDLSLLSPDGLAERGFVRLPTSLEAAIDRFEASKTATGSRRNPAPRKRLKRPQERAGLRCGRFRERRRVTEERDPAQSSTALCRATTQRKISVPILSARRRSSLGWGKPKICACEGSAPESSPASSGVCSTRSSTCSFSQTLLSTSPTLISAKRPLRLTSNFVPKRRRISASWRRSPPPRTPSQFTDNPFSSGLS